MKKEDIFREREVRALKEGELRGRIKLLEELMESNTKIKLREKRLFSEVLLK